MSLWFEFRGWGIVFIYGGYSLKVFVVISFVIVYVVFKINL